MRRSSPGSSDSSASPCTCTKPYGGSSRSVHSVTRGSRASALALADLWKVLKTMQPSSTTNQTGVTSGLPSMPTYASLPVRVPAARNAFISGSVIDVTLLLLAPHDSGNPPCGRDCLLTRHGYGDRHFRESLGGLGGRKLGVEVQGLAGQREMGFADDLGLGRVRVDQLGHIRGFRVPVVDQLALGDKLADPAAH